MHGRIRSPPYLRKLGPQEAMAELGKNYSGGELERGNEPKRHRIHNAPHLHTTITQIMAKTLQSHVMAKSRQETQDVISNLKIKLVVLDQLIHTLQNTNN